MSFLSKIFGDPNAKVVKSYDPIVRAVNAHESAVKQLTDDALLAQSQSLRQRAISTKDLTDEIFLEGAAVIRESIRRTVHQRAYDVQIMAAYALHQASIAEQKTGEGKTLSAVIAAYVNSLLSQGVHIITVNDYLARRDAGWYGPALSAVGISVGCITHEHAYIFDPEYTAADVSDPRLVHLRTVSRPEAYRADITYGTNNEFGFDYLRDNMVARLEDMVQRGLHYAIVDEVDSILIDEARTPLIISAPAEESTDQYARFAALVSKLSEGQDYNIDEKMRAATLTEQGIGKMEKALGIKNIYEAEGIETVHHLEQSLRAHALFKRDRDYVVKDGEIIIVDEFTGRLMFGRRFSEGLHQAIEAKEGVEVKRESRTLATITFQNYFRMYKKLSGMTGTAATEAEEFHKIYELEVVSIPTNKPTARDDRPDSIYKNVSGKYQAIVREVKVRHDLGQPILIGTISVDKNEAISKLLEREGVPHNVLNAKNHEREAKIIADAGKIGAVTVATNMAGRGVDIVLGGEGAPEADSVRVKQLGGLHVIGTERHESRRIDNQLRGRSGRQGDPGSSQFFVSMDDDLMRIFGSDRVKGLMDRMGIPDDMPIENGMISRSIESAQKKVEGHNFDIRKHLVEYDDVINKHREVIYKRRREILAISETDTAQAGDTVHPLTHAILELIENELEQVVSFHTSADDEFTWNLDEIYEVVDTIFPVHLSQRVRLEDIREKAGDRQQDAQARTQLIQYLVTLAKSSYLDLEARIGDAPRMRIIEKAVYLRAIDTLWVEHLDIMASLRQGIGLRGYGQQDPLIEYKKEAYNLFNELMNNIQKNIVYTIFKVGSPAAVGSNPLLSARQQLSAPAKTSEAIPSSPYQNTSLTTPTRTDAPLNTQTTAGGNLKTTEGKKVGRNDPCPCGSGKKYKQCHGK